MKYKKPRKSDLDFFARDTFCGVLIYDKLLKEYGIVQDATHDTVSIRWRDLVTGNIDHEVVTMSHFERELFHGNDWQMLTPHR